VEIITFNDTKYVVKLKTADTGFSANLLTWFKEYKQADTILKKNGLLYFCDTIQDIEFQDL
jgi:hypothetical protein